MEVLEYIKPSNLEEAYNLFVEDKKNYIVAGGAWLKLSIKKAKKLISLDEFNLNEIKVDKDFIEIGALATLREVETNEDILDLCDGILSIALSKIMGINVRNIATLGGSVMGKFAFSDIIPVLEVLDTTLVFFKQGEINLSDFLSNPKFDRDILLKIKIKKENGKGYFKKVAITPLDFSVINLACTNTKSGIKLAIGSTPYIGTKALNTMKYLNNIKEINDEVIEEAQKLMLEELKFSTNLRGSKEYREELAKVYLKRAVKQVIK